MTRPRVLALVQAGGSGGRMDVLTRERAKPALPYGGVHRLIDFTLSSLVHAGLRDLWVSVEYQVASIDEYLSGGRPWDLDSSRRGFRRIVPQTGSGPATEDKFAHGNGDLLLRMARDIEAFGAPTLLVASADHVFAADLEPVVEGHVASGLAATVLTADVTRREAGNNVTVTTDASGLVTHVEEKPARPSTGTVATEIFVYSTEPLLETLRTLRAELSAEAEGDDSGIGDFAEHLIPRLVDQQQVRAVPLDGYWRDLGRPAAYLQGHRDLLAGKVDVFDPQRPIISKWPDRTAARVRPGATVANSLLSPGCDVAGEVVDSVLGPGVVVEAGARVEDSVLFDDVVVARGARVSTSVVDERCRIGRNATVGAIPGARVARDEDLVLVGMESSVRARADVAAGARLEPGTTA
ncbi:MAG: glucose-phosphate adenylyltransferase [Nocardioidaceae bacterium]|jgi:glucose-1-phosphate adenylyltransferase|nr:glucose-phosphate adenylyltransferase [Nocardioidaceae bacterium]